MEKNVFVKKKFQSFVNLEDQVNLFYVYDIKRHGKRRHWGQRGKSVFDYNINTSQKNPEFP